MSMLTLRCCSYCTECFLSVLAKSGIYKIKEPAFLWMGFSSKWGDFRTARWKWPKLSPGIAKEMTRQCRWHSFPKWQMKDLLVPFCHDFQLIWTWKPLKPKKWILLRTFYIKLEQNSKIVVMYTFQEPQYL